MYELLSSVVMSGALGAQFVLTLVLLKGDICPGQRGRLHKAFWFLVAAWALVVPFSPFSALPFIALGIFSLRSKSGKTRLSGPIPVLLLANGFGALAVLISAWHQGMFVGLLMISQVALVGAITGHCLLVRARSRLQAFHRILPVAGIVAAMLMALVIAVASTSMPEASANALVTSVLTSLGLVLVGVIIWAFHLLRQTPPHLLQLCCALIVIGGASGVAMSALI
ncbi:hypothetical protein A1OO_18075 [Enterovibrio norvegicus FF-33]|uniref:Uncharacterized protein n=1 Tax=Enterovibrio norvegicus FF-454 TaxID=1185651 RepID=A0A1E5C101_9GAMM|nr:hypothetical protein [Enterovibrio norvegicus]OEE59193.1 hypothetical protein A1OK_04055 [Enterovibrio norvegicus FF-454]OEE67649.1 hypothetical protein A1OO_18075 [Enterovibrio norvegicus FF-33]OEE87495.1 hypothetical protein A1OQ_15120 [Enterovibrio norvegicus FF-162]